MSARAVSTASEVALRETLKYYEISTWVLAGFVVLLAVACVVVAKIYWTIEEQKQDEAYKQYELKRAEALRQYQAARA